jgi:hypothetical protein
MNEKVVRPPEYWVMRVWTRWVDGRRYVVAFDDCSAAVQVAVGAAIGMGTLAVLPGGLIGEPVEVYEEQCMAEARRANEQQRNPLEDFRVVMNADI